MKTFLSDLEEQTRRALDVGGAISSVMFPHIDLDEIEAGWRMQEQIERDLRFARAFGVVIDFDL
jgi:hypothetical protein